MILGVVGSRAFLDYELLKTELLTFSSIDVIVSGGARGADKLAEQYALEFNIPILIFKPDYKTHGIAAPFIRNTEIIEASDKVIAFWDGKSTGTLDSINKAKQRKIPLKIVFYNSSQLDC